MANSFNSASLWEKCKDFNWLAVSPVLILVLVFQSLTFFDVKFRYEIQKYVACLPYSLYMSVGISQNSKIDISDMVVLSGNFAPEHFPADIEILKLVAAKGGDTIHRTGNFYYINGDLAGDFMSHKTPFLADGASITLTNDQYWLLATSERATDSRYFGPVTSELFIGKGYALL